MSSSSKKEVEEQKVAVLRVSLLKKATLIYLLMACVGCMIIHFSHHKFFDFFSGGYFSIDNSSFRISDFEKLSNHLILSFLGIGVLLTLSYLFEHLFVSYRGLKQILVGLFGSFSVPSLIYLAGVSAVGEEILFRGALQPHLGLAFTSILFGFAHIGPNGRISSWTLWALLGGLMLGWMFQNLQSLWPPIICHFGVNVISMVNLRRIYSSREQDVGTKDKSASNDDFYMSASETEADKGKGE